MKRLVAVAGLLSAGIGLAGCGSSFVSTKIVNDTDTTFSTVEVDYPGGSFGTSNLQPHGSYSYRFKSLGTGVLQMTLVDAHGSHELTGPEVHNAQTGTLYVGIEPHGHVQWRLSPR